MCLEKAGVITRSQWTYSVALIGRCNKVTTNVTDEKKAPAGSLLFTSFGGGSRHIGLKGKENTFFDIAAEGDTIRKLSVKSWGSWEKAGQYPGVDYSSALTLNYAQNRFDVPEGYLDSVTSTKISGWAYDGTDCPLTVHIYVHEGNERVALFAATAGDYRGDLKDAGKGDGNHAFNVDYDFSKNLGAGTYTVTVYAINESEGGVNPKLVNEHTVNVEESAYKVWVGKATTLVNIRTGTGVNYEALTAWPQLGEGNLVEVTDERKASDGALWYEVKIAGRYIGWVNAKYLVKA